MIPSSTVAHYKQMQRLQALVVVAAADLWSEASLSDLSGSWAAQVPLLAPVLSGVQVKAATAGAAYGAATLAEQGLYEAPKHFVDSSAFGGFASDGRSLAGLLFAPIPHVKTLIAGGMDPGQALVQGGKFLTTLTRTQVADAGRGAAGVDIAARPRMGFTRMLNPPSCSRCSILAGKFYRWNTGFNRHPRCDCVHIPTQENVAGSVTTDPYEYFKSMSAEDQDKAYTKAGAQAIRDGGDIFQVVNSRRGMKPGGLMTTEGVTKRGNFRSVAGDSTRGRRMTPEAIYKLNGDNRAAALKDLERYGYILPGGQNPLGSIVGQREGFGALGGGGARKAASQAVLDARASGVRDGSRYTMTEAERRLYDAQMRWSMVQQGRNPYSSPGFGNKPDPFGVGVNKSGAGNAPLTPAIAAQVEKDYRRWLSTGGQVFK